MSRIIIPLIYYLICIINAKNQWYIAQQNDDSQHPSPRSVPFFTALNSTHAILYGGFLEHIEDNSLTNCGDNAFYNDIYILDASNPELAFWTRINNASDSIAPPAGRAYGCVVYSPNLNSLFLYGGIAFSKEFDEVTSYGDSWSFNLTSLEWTLIEAAAPPGNLSGIDCDIVSETDTVYLTHGTLNSLANFQNKTWKWDLHTNTWTLLFNNASDKPASRALNVFRRIPHTNEFLFFDGLVLTSHDASKAVHFTDVWRFNINTLVWMNQTVINPPSARGSFGYALTSTRWFFMYGGDISTNRSIADNCFPPLECYTSVDPNHEAYFLRLFFPNVVDWSDELDFDFSPPSLRHSSIAVLPPNLYLVGGMDWSGKNGVGEQYNFYTWTVTLPDFYFQNE